MAKGTIYGKTSDPNIQVKIEWESIPHPENFSTTYRSHSSVGATLYYKSTSGGISGRGEFSITVCGNTLTHNRYVEINSNGWAEAISFSGTELHGDNGLATAKISASGSIPGTDLLYHEVSGSAKLDYIPQGSTIAAVSDAVLGEPCAVRWVPNSTDYKYKVEFSIGERSYTTPIIIPNRTTVFDYSGYALPLDAANEITTSNTGVMKATLYTYLDTEATKQIGEGKSQTFTVTVPDNDSTKPTTSFILNPVNSLSSPFNTLFIGENTKASGVFVDGKGKYGASVVSYEMVVDGKSYGDPYTSDFLTKTGITEVRGIVTDSRGYSRIYAREIEVIEYNEPRLLPASAERTIICTRCDSEGTPTDTGRYLKIKAKRGYSKVISGENQMNFCDLRYRCTTDGGSFVGDQGWKTLLSGNSLDTDLVDAVIPNEVTSIEDAYIVQIGVIDRLGNFTTAQFGISTSFVTIDIPDKHKGRRIGIGRYAEDSTEPGVDMGMPIHGGGVDNLTLGERITATSSSPTNLDNIKTPGNYYASSGQYIYNSPYTDGGFTLEVREMDDKNHIKQTLCHGAETWLRYWDSAEWSEWVRNLGTDTNSSVAVDFVIEEGIKNGWTYKKWKGGTFEMHGVFNLTPAQRNVVGGNIYSSEQMKITAPFGITTAVISGTATNSFFIAEGGLVNGDIGVTLFIPINFSIGRKSNVSLHVTGEYK